MLLIVNFAAYLFICRPSCWWTLHPESPCFWKV